MSRFHEACVIISTEQKQRHINKSRYPLIKNSRYPIKEKKSVLDNLTLKVI